MYSPSIAVLSAMARCTRSRGPVGQLSKNTRKEAATVAVSFTINISLVRTGQEACTVSTAYQRSLDLSLFGHTAYTVRAPSVPLAWPCAAPIPLPSPLPGPVLPPSPFRPGCLVLCCPHPPSVPLVAYPIFMVSCTLSNTTCYLMAVSRVHTRSVDRDEGPQLG